jgi:hypothetical protein
VLKLFFYRFNTPAAGLADEERLSFDAIFEPRLRWRLKEQRQVRKEALKALVCGPPMSKELSFANWR